MIYSNRTAWQVVFVSKRAKKEIDELPHDMRVHFDGIVGLIQDNGIDDVHEPYIKHLSGKLWEMRLRGKSGIARTIYLIASERRVVVLHTFIKKTQKTPQDSIELAFRRAIEGGWL